MVHGTLVHRFSVLSGHAARIRAAESVSGSVGIDFASSPSARFQLRSFSGDIGVCPAVQPAAGAASAGRSGQRSRDFRNGDGDGRVEVQTMSGDIRLCAGR